MPSATVIITGDLFTVELITRELRREFKVVAEIDKIERHLTLLVEDVPVFSDKSQAEKEEER